LATYHSLGLSHCLKSIFKLAVSLKAFLQIWKLVTHSDGESHEGHDHEPPQIFEDEQLAFLVDPVLKTEDVNNDGFIDYAEFIAAQIKTKIKAKNEGIRHSS